MSWTGNSSHATENGRFADAQAAQAVVHDAQNRRAARVVASRSLDAVDCAEMLAMLGLDAAGERASVQ